LCPTFELFVVVESGLYGETVGRKSGAFNHEMLQKRR